MVDIFGKRNRIHADKNIKRAALGSWQRKEQLEVQEASLLNQNIRKTYSLFWNRRHEERRRTIKISVGGFRARSKA